MTTTKPEQTETDLTREQRVIKGVAKPAPAKRASSRASKGAAKNAATPKPARRPTGAASLEANDKKSAAPKPPTQSEMQHVVMKALIDAGAKIATTWTDKRVPRDVAAQMLADRLSYCPSAKSLWNDKLPTPARLK